VIAAMLIAARNIIPAFRYVDTLKGDDKTLNELVESGKKDFVGTELPQQTLGILGLGKIGSLVADAAIKLGMDVLGYDPHITVDAAWSLPSQVRKAGSMEEVLKGSDYVTLHVPLNDSTRGTINAERIQLMRSGAILLNFARDALVDPDAVREALNAKRLQWYVCDFPSSRLQGHPRVVALPHLGASTREAEDNCAVMVVDQVRNFLEQGNIANAVNFPDALLEREAPYRVAIANANVPNMLGQISTAMARAGLNIHDMLNKSKGEMAYTLVDVDSTVPEGLLQELARIKGVLSVRYLPQQ
jgi:D-3-phosphoglycerate dehydrogenase